MRKIAYTKKVHISDSKIKERIMESCADSPYYNTYMGLSEEEAEDINSAIVQFMNTLRSVGVAGALELVGALGMFLAKGEQKNGNGK